jgi:SWI/SNF related-matrix-associated actin-dependent regulator of chromatin subfamily C
MLDSLVSKICYGHSKCLEVSFVHPEPTPDEKQQITIPSMTLDWYDPNSVSDIEKNSLPEFFSGLYPSKTPDVYKEYRSFIVSLSQMQPETYLTVTACRRHLSGDACAILRVH